MDDDFIDSWIEKERQESIKAKAAANVQRRNERLARRRRAAHGLGGVLAFIVLLTFIVVFITIITLAIKATNLSPSPSPTVAAMKSEGKYLPKIFETFEV